jgi:acetyltransferase-like isoleucine patch superfamily enzyme
MLPAIRFPVINPEYKFTKNNEFRVPVLREVMSRIGWTLRLFIDPDAQVHQVWYPPLESGDADFVKCKERFRFFAQHLRTLFPAMCTTDREEGTDLHPALRDIGAEHFYGGWERKFDASAKLQGPIWVGPRVSFRSSSKVLGPSLIESNVTIGTSAIVNRSIVCRGSEIDAAAQVADSIIGRNVYIGPSVLLLHKTLSGEMEPMNEGVLLKNRKKCGVIVGDGCRIGADAIIEPGTILMPGCIVPIRRHVRAGLYRPEDFR